jgi:hypothetical protein
MSLLNYSRHNPASDFPSSPSSPGVWSSSSYAYDTSRAWHVNFDIGGVVSYYKVGTYDVRCVRLGP